jgi:hypothetical protein
MELPLQPFAQRIAGQLDELPRHVQLLPVSQQGLRVHDCYLLRERHLLHWKLVALLSAVQ